MTAKDLGLDYFKFYDAANQRAGYVVGLQGQFDRVPERAQLTYLNMFANPTSKNGEAIHDKNAHLTFYNLYDPSPDPMRKVTFENQFGKQTVVTGRAYALLVPTQKVKRGSVFPEKLDHYKVYQVLDSEQVNKRVKLKDQFAATEARVYYPLFFAVPVRKWYEGQVYGVNNAKAHLAIYRIYPDSLQKTIATRDQFSQRYLNLFRGVLLAAPSRKLEWKEV